MYAVKCMKPQNLTDRASDNFLRRGKVLSGEGSFSRNRTRLLQGWHSNPSTMHKASNHITSATIVPCEASVFRLH